MSHVLDTRSAKLRDKMRIINIQALRLAAEKLGLVMKSAEELECEPHKGTYMGYKTEMGRLANDWPMPEGWTLEELEQNADYVISLSDQQKEAYMGISASNRTVFTKHSRKFYEIGIVWDAKEKAWFPHFDFAEAGGRALQHFAGEVKRENYEVVSSLGTLMNWYHGFCDKLRAEELGEICELEAGEKGEVISYIYEKEVEKSKLH